MQTEALELTKSPEKKLPPKKERNYYSADNDDIASPKANSGGYNTHHSPAYGSEACGIINLSMKSGHNNESANTPVAISPVLKVPSFYDANSPAKPATTSSPPPIKSEEMKNYTNLRLLLEANKSTEVANVASIASPAKSSDAESSMPGSPDSKDGRKTQTECHICLKTFQYRSSYRRHMRIHQGVYTHICAACNRKFTRKEHFVRHKCNRKPNIPHRSANRVELLPEAQLAPNRTVQPKVEYPPNMELSMGGLPPVYSPHKHSIPENFMAMHPRPHVEHLPAQCNESRRKKAQPRKLIVGENMQRGMDEEDEEVIKAYHSPVHTPNSMDSQNSNPGSPEDLSMSHTKSSAVQNLSQFHDSEQPMETEDTSAPIRPIKPIVITPDNAGMDTISTTTGTYQIEQEEDKCIKVTKQSNYLKLRNEAQTVNGKTEFSCPVCGKLFQRSSNFSRHMRLHRGVFSYVCKTCNRGFFRKEHFQKHKCSHRGMLPNTGTAIDTMQAMLQLAKSESPAAQENIVPANIPAGAEEGIDMAIMDQASDHEESEDEEGNLVVDESAGLSEDEEDLNSPLPPPVPRA
jgi:predicted RNA-binding Zn-ribbon protein involved in translation (DUF1610 family)